MKMISKKLERISYAWETPHEWKSLNSQECICSQELDKYFSIPKTAKFIWIELTPLKEKQPEHSSVIEIKKHKQIGFSDEIILDGKEIDIFSYPEHYVDKNKDQPKLKATKYYLRILYQ